MQGGGGGGAGFCLSGGDEGGGKARCLECIQSPAHTVLTQKILFFVFETANINLFSYFFLFLYVVFCWLDDRVN